MRVFARFENVCSGIGPAFEPSGYGPIFEPHGYGPIFEPNG